MARLFFALWPESPVREALALQATNPIIAAPGARLTHPENLHLTLAFLGSVPRERLREVLQAAAGVSAGHFVLTLDRLEYWASSAMYCLTPSVVPPPLHALAGELRDALRARDLPAEERPYRPHVTLCRKAQRRRPTAVTAINWPAQEFVLAESAHVANGVVYRIVARWPLRTGENGGAI